MAGKRPGASEQSLTVLHRAARLYEGECWWLSDRQDEVRGLLLLDGGPDLTTLRLDLMTMLKEDGRFVFEKQGVSRDVAQPVRTRVSHSDCQVTVEERFQLFSPFQGN